MHFCDVMMLFSTN